MDPASQPAASDDAEPRFSVDRVLRNHVVTAEACFADVTKHGFITVENARAYRQAKAMAWLYLSQITDDPNEPRDRSPGNTKS